MGAEDWVVVGTIVAPHGVRGEVRVIPETAFPQRLTTLKEVTLLLPDGATRLVTVTGGRMHAGRGAVLLSLAGCPTRTEAAKLRGCRLAVPPADSPQLPEGEYYEWQIIGLRAVTTDGRSLGTVREVLHTGANDVYLTDSVLLPAIAEVVKSIDLDAGTLVIEPLPGLLDEASDE